MTNPFEDAIHFLLHDRVSKGDGPSSARAQKHIEAIDAAKAKEAAAAPVAVPAAGVAGIVPAAAPVAPLISTTKEK
jgi:hypothetical protein